jgi:vacuolar-type H+-ATPase subunit D/Vma8
MKTATILTATSLLCLSGCVKKSAYDASTQELLRTKNELIQTRQLLQESSNELKRLKEERETRENALRQLEEMLKKLQVAIDDSQSDIQNLVRAIVYDVSPQEISARADAARSNIKIRFENYPRIQVGLTEIVIGHEGLAKAARLFEAEDAKLRESRSQLISSGNRNELGRVDSSRQQMKEAYETGRNSVRLIIAEKEQAFRSLNMDLQGYVTKLKFDRLTVGN